MEKSTVPVLVPIVKPLLAFDPEMTEFIFKVAELAALKYELLAVKFTAPVIAPIELVLLLVMVPPFRAMGFAKVKPATSNVIPLLMVMSATPIGLFVMVLPDNIELAPSTKTLLLLPETVVDPV